MTIAEGHYNNTKNQEKIKILEKYNSTENKTKSLKN